MKKNEKHENIYLFIQLLTLSLAPPLPPPQNNVHTQKTYRIKIIRLKLANIWPISSGKLPTLISFYLESLGFKGPC